MRRRALFFLMMGLALAGCGSSRVVKATDENPSARLTSIDDSIAKHSLTVTFSYVVPRRMPSHALTDDYWIRVKGDSIDSHLPFFGVSYRADLGQTGSPLSFKGLISGYQVVERHRDRRVLRVTTRHNMEQVDYYLTLGDSGYASLNVMSSAREGISFNGEVNL